MAAKPRLFFALLPNHETLEQIRHWREQLQPLDKEREIPDFQIHITLKYIGAVPEESVDEFSSIENMALFKSFELIFTRAYFWKRSGVFVLQAENIPGELSRLRSYLDVFCEKQGIEREERQFKPHITLIRKAIKRQQPAPEVSIRWKANGVALMASYSTRTGVEYKVVKQWIFNKE